MFDSYSGPTKLRDIAEITMGQSPPGDSVTEMEIGIPFLQGCAEFGQKHPKHKRRCLSTTKICEPNDILISVRAPVGEINFADQKYCIGRGLASIRFHEGFPPNYGWWLLEHSRILLRKIAQGSTFEAISRRDIENLMLNVSPFQDRDAISAILDSADEKIRQTEAVIAKLRRVKTGLLQDLLARGIDEKGELRDTNSHPEQFKDSPVGRVPKHWESNRMGDVLTRRPRNGFSPKEKNGFTGAFVLGLGCLTVDGFKALQLKAIDPAEVSGENILQDGDLLVSRSNTSELVALPGVYKDIGYLCTYPDLMIRLVPKNCILPRFLELLLRNTQLRNHLVCNANGTSASMVKINAETIVNAPVVYPDISEQKRILNVVDSFNKKMSELQREREKLACIKQGLMQDLLTGRVLVSKEMIRNYQSFAEEATNEG